MKKRTAAVAFQCCMCVPLLGAAASGEKCPQTASFSCHENYDLSPGSHDVLVVGKLHQQQQFAASKEEEKKDHNWRFGGSSVWLFPRGGASLQEKEEEEEEERDGTDDNDMTTEQQNLESSSSSSQFVDVLFLWKQQQQDSSSSFDRFPIGLMELPPETFPSSTIRESSTKLQRQQEDQIVMIASTQTSNNNNNKRDNNRAAARRRKRNNQKKKETDPLLLTPESSSVGGTVVQIKDSSMALLLSPLLEERVASVSNPDYWEGEGRTHSVQQQVSGKDEKEEEEVADVVGIQEEEEEEVQSPQDDMVNKEEEEAEAEEPNSLIDDDDEEDKVSAVGEEKEEDEEEEDVSWDDDTMTAQEIMERTQQLRTEGKSLHDEGDYVAAARVFVKAAKGLEALLVRQEEKNAKGEEQEQDDNDNDDDDVIVDIHTLQQDAAACRLHQALCCIKEGGGGTMAKQAIQACNHVLAYTSLEPALRARAFYRRAKARLQLVKQLEQDEEAEANEEEEETNDSSTKHAKKKKEEEAAIRDARSAAFLGDRKAVELYGQLLRNSDASGSTGSSDLFPGLASSLQQPSSSTTTTGDSPAAAASGDAAADLFSSLLGIPSPDGGSPASPFSPPPSLPQQGGLPPLFGGGDPSAGGGGTLASLLGLGGADGMNALKKKQQSLVKSLSSKKTQTMICAALQSTSGPQIQQFAGMAGMDVSSQRAQRIAALCHSVQPKHLKACVNNGRRLWYGVRLMQKTGSLLAKYRTIFVCLFLLVWIKSLYQQ